MYSIHKYNLVYEIYYNKLYLFFPSLNKSLTRAAPNPPSTSINSDPFIDKNGTFASVATAFANSVLPQPGGPNNKAPESNLDH